jgi:hypothetical protein
MSFSVQTKINMVVQESAGETYPMLLPWERHLTDQGSTARIGGGVIPPGSQNLLIAFPNITTLTTLWFYPEVAMQVTLGNGQNQALSVGPGGCVGFMGAAVAASNALHVTYTGTDPGGYCVVWCGGDAPAWSTP